MEAQLHRSYGSDEEQPQHTGVHSEGEVEHHHEKKSVLKKVKAKAKKIKASIKQLGQEHEHEPEHGHDQHDDLEDDEEDEDDEMVDDPEVHGAPIYESSAIRTGVVPHKDVGLAPKSAGNLEHPSSRTEHIAAEHGGLERTKREPGASFGALTGLQQHPQAPMDKPNNPSNDQSKVTHPLMAPRTEEAGVPPLLQSTGKMTIEDETRPNSRREGTLNSNLTTEKEPGARSGVLTGLQKDPQASMDKPDPSNYQSKVTDPTGHRAEAEGVPPLVASFGKMTVEDEASPNTIGSAAEQGKSYTGSHDQFSPEAIPTSTHLSPESTPKQFNSTQSEGEMPRDTIDEKLPGSSYTDKISSGASVIADKATTAKNVVASKLGYGGGTQEGTHTSTTNSAATNSPHSSPTGYAHKAAAAVTETLAPIYGKVAGVGSAAASKVPGIATRDRQEGITDSSMKENKGRGVTMTEYLAEKLRPGDEDKALSEVISDTLHIQKEKTTTMAAGGEAGGKKPIERVTESEEVVRQLGSEQENQREGTDALISGSESSGNTVVDKIKDAVTSWVTKGGESPTSHQGEPADSSGNLDGSKNGVVGNN